MHTKPTARKPKQTVSVNIAKEASASRHQDAAEIVKNDTSEIEATDMMVDRDTRITMSENVATEK